MILVVHNISTVLKVHNISKNRNVDFDKKKSIGSIVHALSNEFPEELIIWSNELVVDKINYERIELIFHHDAILASYSTAENYAIPCSIGYVEQSPFLKVKKNVSYPTWLMSSTVGGARGILISKFDKILNLKEPFPLVLNHLGKTAQKLGAFCYSNPSLLLDSSPIIEENQANLFSFVKQHYKRKWLFLLLFNLFIYEKKFPFYKFIQGFIKRKLDFSKIDLTHINWIQSKLKVSNFSIDVVIPTMGRKKFLKNVLLDLANQTLLPNKVIIIEQKIDKISELNFLDDNWPFKIKHLCISKFGACNARNLGLKEVTSNWVFLADDDNRIDTNLLEQCRDNLVNYGLECLTTSYLQKGENEVNKNPIQWSTFGAGNSIINSALLNQVSFDESFEFGYGEDVDFGMQLRNLGVDIIYFPKIKIKHLKAPIGGFRSIYKHPWDRDIIEPKPSPTIMNYHLKHDTKKQLLGYKSILFLKYYKIQSIKNPCKYILEMNKKWSRSIFWAKKLINHDV